MSNTRPEDLADALGEVLGLYHEDVTEAINHLSEEATKQLVKRTRATAPKGARGSFKKNIASRKLATSPNGDTFVWYVKPPDHRLTHLLVKGHATRDGGRTRKDPFLQNALDEVVPEYTRQVEEALKK